MKPFLFLLSVSAVCLPLTTLADEALFATHCGSCHTAPGQPRQAPPPFAVQRMLKHRFADKDTFIERIIDWTANPTEDNPIMKHAVEKFGVMPKPDVSEEDVRKIAAYLFEANFAKPHRQHKKDH